MSASNTVETNVLALLLNATAWANVADNAASSPLTALFVALHTADPTDSGTQATNEVAYTNYARQSVARTSGGWTVSGDTASNAGVINWPLCGATGATATHFSIGIAVSGATAYWFSGALTTPLVINPSTTTPTAAIGALSVVCT